MERIPAVRLERRALRSASARHFDHSIRLQSCRGNLGGAQAGQSGAGVAGRRTGDPGRAIVAAVPGDVVWTQLPGRAHIPATRVRQRQVRAVSHSADYPGYPVSHPVRPGVAGRPVELASVGRRRDGGEPGAHGGMASRAMDSPAVGRRGVCCVVQRRRGLATDLFHCASPAQVVSNRRGGSAGRVSARHGGPCHHPNLEPALAIPRDHPADCAPGRRRRAAGRLGRPPPSDSVSHHRRPLRS